MHGHSSYLVLPEVSLAHRARLGQLAAGRLDRPEPLVEEDPVAGHPEERHALVAVVYRRVFARNYAASSTHGKGALPGSRRALGLTESKTSAPRPAC